MPSDERLESKSYVFDYVSGKRKCFKLTVINGFIKSECFWKLLLIKWMTLVTQKYGFRNIFCVSTVKIINRPKPVLFKSIQNAEPEKLSVFCRI
jgi:hypothetical protein